MTRLSLVIAILGACGGAPPATTTPPPPPAAASDCASAVHNTMALSAEEMKTMTPQMASKMPQMAELMIKRCNEDKWSAAAIGCMSSARTREAMQTCGAKLDGTQTKNVYDDVAALMGATPAPEPAAGIGDLPAECASYKLAVEKMMRCDKMPAASRDAMKQGLEAMEQGFASWGDLPPDARRNAMDAAATGCQAGRDAVLTSLKAMGC